MNERTILLSIYQLNYARGRLRVQHEKRRVLESEISMVRSERAHLEELLAKVLDDSVAKANSYAELKKDIVSSESTIVGLQYKLKSDFIKASWRRSQQDQASKESEFLNMLKDLSGVPPDAPSTTLPEESVRNAAREERTDLPRSLAEDLRQFAELSAPSNGPLHLYQNAAVKESSTNLEPRYRSEYCHIRDPSLNRLGASLSTTRTSSVNVPQDPNCPSAACDESDKTKQALAQGTDMAWDPDHLELVEALRRGDNSWAGQSAE